MLEVDSLPAAVAHLNRLNCKGIQKPITVEMVLKVKGQELVMYDDQDIAEIIFELRQAFPTKEPEPRTPARYKSWAEAREKKIRQKEAVLWSRKSYQEDLDKLADKWHIPREGFSDDAEEATLWNGILWLNWLDMFRKDLMGVVEKHSSSRLQLGREWCGAVERHLLRRSDSNRQDQVYIRVALDSPPQIGFDMNEKGEVTHAHLTDITVDTPLEVIKEYKKDLKVFAKEWGQTLPKRENVSTKRERAKKLYEDPQKILTAADMALHRRYAKLIAEETRVS